MKRTLIIPILCFAMYVAVAQQTSSGQPYPVTRQYNTPTSWDNTNMSIMEPTDLPSSVNTSFTSRYPNQTDVTWYKYDNGYIASYKDKSNMDQRMIYDLKGNPVYMGKQIKAGSLPPTTSTYLKSNYPDATYDNLYEVNTPAGETIYQVLVNGKWMKFDKNGNMVPIK